MNISPLKFKTGLGQFAKTCLSRRGLKRALPIAIIVFFILLIALLKSNQPQSKPAKEYTKKTKVFAVRSKEKNQILRVSSQGEVTPLSVLDMRNEIAGTVIYASPKFVAGGEFNRGDILIEIDPVPYQLAVVQKRARVAAANESYQKTKAESDAAITELRNMGRDNASELARGLPQLRGAEASLASAEAELKLAELELSYTKIRAPFDGRIKDKHVFTGQYIAKNSLIATLFSTDLAEIRLPLTPEQIVLLGLPLAYYAEYTESPFNVTFSMDLGAQTPEWQGRIVRTEAVVDNRTRVIYAVARVSNPYTATSVPLLAGAFVNAQISGEKKRTLSALPAKALRNGNQLWLVKNKRLAIVDADIVQRGRDTLLVAGLPSGTVVITSTLPIPIEGMLISVTKASLPSAQNSQDQKIKITPEDETALRGKGKDEKQSKQLMKAAG